MIEICALKNPIYQPHLEAWGWEVAVYLFLGGLVAGLMVMGGGLYLGGKPEYRQGARVASLLGPVLLAVGMLALLRDLGRPLNVYRFYLTFKITSPMSWGAWILVLAGLAMVGLALNLWRPSPGGKDPGVPVLAWANVVLGAALGAYTGLLLSLMLSRPLWHSPLLPPLFLASGISAGVALLMGAARSGALRHLLCQVDLWLIGAEAVLLAAYGLTLAAGAPGSREALALVMAGPYGTAFWVLVVGLGMVAPLALELGQLLLRRERAWAGWAAASLVLVGGFSLRWIAVFAGQISRF